VVKGLGYDLLKEEKEEVSLKEERKK